MEAAGTSVTLHFSSHSTKRLNVSPILTCLLKVIENTSFAFIDLAQDETRVAGRGRVGIRRVRVLRTLGNVVAQESFLPVYGSA